MRRHWSIVLALAAGLSLAGCDAGPRSGLGFRLPDGDTRAGEAAFRDLGCHACHEVKGRSDLPRPTADPPVPIVLGGREHRQRTDGELLTSILNPSHRLASHRPGVAAEGSALSRMGDLSEAMTARQLVDLVAFLQSRYEYVPARAMR